MSCSNQAAQLPNRSRANFETWLSVEHSRAVAIQKTRRLSPLAQLHVNFQLLLAATAVTVILVGIGTLLATALLIRRLANWLSV